MSIKRPPFFSTVDFTVAVEVAESWAPPAPTTSTPDAEVAEVAELGRRCWCCWCCWPRQQAGWDVFTKKVVILRMVTRWCPSSLAKLVYKSNNYGL